MKIKVNKSNDSLNIMNKRLYSLIHNCSYLKEFNFIIMKLPFLKKIDVKVTPYK
jgi:hypothetical protein